MSEERLAAIESRLDSVETTLGDLGNQMRVVHKGPIDNIKALAPDLAPIRREFTQADDGLREEFDRRLRPLEREHRKHR